MKLVVGKTYISRSGSIVKIVKRNDWNVNYPFRDESGEEYGVDGISIKQYGIRKCESDLIREKENEKYISKN